MNEYRKNLRLTFTISLCLLFVGFSFSQNENLSVLQEKFKIASANYNNFKLRNDSVIDSLETLIYTDSVVMGNSALRGELAKECVLLISKKNDLLQELKELGEQIRRVKKSSEKIKETNELDLENKFHY